MAAHQTRPQPFRVRVSCRHGGNDFPPRGSRNRKRSSRPKKAYLSFHRTIHPGQRAPPRCFVKQKRSSQPVAQREDRITPQTRIVHSSSLAYLRCGHGDELHRLFVPELEVAPLPHRENGLRARHSVVSDQDLPRQESTAAATRATAAHEPQPAGEEVWA